MNLTLSIDEEILKNARAAAQSKGTSVNEMVREYLQQFSTQEDIERSIAQFHKTSGLGDRDSWKFDREELYERT